MPRNSSVDDRHASSSDTFSVDERTLCDPTSDNDDERDSPSRPSADMSEGDHDILESEDERERLLTKGDGMSGIFGKKGVRIGKHEQKQPSVDKRRQRKGGQDDESSALMYEMEEGVGTASGSLSRHSSESDEQRLLATGSQRKASAAEFNA